MPIPAFDHNLVLPPHLGSPTIPNELSPYEATSLELVEQFATSPQRKTILRGLLGFRERLQNLNLIEGFQWLDGSFLEDIEAKENRPPNDLDIVTIYWGYDGAFQANVVANLPEFQDAALAKAHFHLDHYPFDASYHPLQTVQYTRYWIQLFTHNRDKVWKGMIMLPLNTPGIDSQALQFLNQNP